MTEIQALLLLKASLESADIHGVESILSEDCEYMSTGRGIIGRNRNETIDFLSSMMESIKADRVPVNCNVMHITDVYEEGALFVTGRHGLTVSYESGDTYVYMLFVDMNDEGLVDRIVSSQENYSIAYDTLRLNDDEPEYAFTMTPTTVKDWITSLSIWLETDNVDIDDFYRYIDEDTRVVFQKGDAESITLESGLDVEDYFDQLMNQHFDAVPHIIRDDDDNLILTYGPMSLIATLNKDGALALISIYIDMRDEDELSDEVGYIEEDITEIIYDDEDITEVAHDDFE
ncbi:hypothetical protein VEHSUH05_08155 [Veillonella denticariosi JCM 15641]|uniref:Uncharacterized protein n=1 Tax=Veillonella denticariosi JCM 15641 TaxID=1298594 RepID=A0A2S7Z7S9_9FIRM|nr:hypothetical protein [Veillonella denticariosi]PQL19328.1 hypothetical protein VEHSUH05_08155 [Veillonella denticariosi JCM 15641]